MFQVSYYDTTWNDNVLVTVSAFFLWRCAEILYLKKDFALESSYKING